MFNYAIKIFNFYVKRKVVVHDHVVHYHVYFFVLTIFMKIILLLMLLLNMYFCFNLFILIEYR